MPDEVWDTDHYIYQLGPAIVPSKIVKAGKIFCNGRVWTMLDTLLTCDTISEARDLTRIKIGNINDLIAQKLSHIIAIMVFYGA